MSRPFRAIAAALLAIALAAFAAQALADVTRTVTPGKWPLQQVMPDKTIKEIGRYNTQALCEAAITAVGEFRCNTSVAIKAVDNCANVKAPTVPLVKDAAGNWELPEAFAIQPDKADPTRWATVQNLYVRAPAGAATCWIRGLTDPAEWRINGTNPAAPFMELVVTGMADLTDPPPEPYTGEADWPPELLALYEASAAERVGKLYDLYDDPVTP
jgi:hypothetical protein